MREPAPSAALPDDPVLGEWDYDPEAGRTQTARRSNDPRPFPHYVVYESPMVFGTDGRYWEGFVRTSPPDGRWERSSVGTYLVTFTRGDRAGLTFSFHLDEQSIVITTWGPGRVYHSRRPDASPRAR